jgi:hypothetical protein
MTDPTPRAPRPWLDDHATLGLSHTIEIPGNGRTLSVKIASGFDDYEQAFLLLARKYQAKGYEEPGIKLFRFTPFHVLPETITVVARDGANVVATLSIVPDTTLLGLPMEAIFGEELDRLRRDGRRIAEVTSLADEGLNHREFAGVFAAMTRLVWQVHIRAGGETWVVAVNPRHGAYYRKRLGAVALGDRRSYPAVLDAPAEAYLIDRVHLQANDPEMYANVYGAPLAEEVLTPPARPSDHVEFFGAHSTVSDRRTIREIARVVDQFGSPPRWREAEDLDPVSRTASPLSHRPAA